MLNFNPEHQLLFKQNRDYRLRATLTISNPSPRPVCFKVCPIQKQIKASKPTYFDVSPCVSLLLSHQIINIEIITRHVNTPQLIHDISYQNKFQVEYALLNKIPNSIEEGLSMITDENKQKQKLFVAIENKTYTTPQSYSGFSDKYSYRSTFNDNRSQEFMIKKNKNRLEPQDIMNQQQKIDYLSRQIDKLEIQKAHLIASSKPHSGLNIFRLLIVLVVCILTGYLAGKSIFRKNEIAKKQRQYRWFGLEKYFVKQQQQPESWCIFWK